MACEPELSSSSFPYGFKMVDESPVKLNDTGFIYSYDLRKNIKVRVTRNPFEITDILCWSYMNPINGMTTWRPIWPCDMWLKDDLGVK